MPEDNNLTEEVIAEATEEATAEMVEMPDFDPEEWERRRLEAKEKELAGAKAAAAQRKENAAIIAEHDEMLADILFEITMDKIADK